MTNALLYRMASGVPGDISRRANSIVDSLLRNSSLTFTAYGLPGKMVSGKFVPIVASDVGADVKGFLVRPYPTQTASSDGTGVSEDPVYSVMKSGYMTVKNNVGTPAVDGKVYLRVAAPAGAKVIGGLEAAAEVGAVGAAVGGNTGNGTIGTVSATAVAEAGVYRATMLTATTFRVQTPSGERLIDGATGTAYTADGVTFTITVGGTPMIAGDAFTITVTPAAVEIPGARFTSAADANGNVEIEFNV